MSKSKMGYIFPKKIRAALRGEKTSISVGYTSGSAMRQIGDEWTDADGNKWVQKNGYQEKMSKLDDARFPLFCPKCSNIMANRHDTKMYSRWGMCFKCVIKRDTDLKIKGKFKYFEKRSILVSYREMLRESEEAFLEYQSNLKPVTEYVNEDGSTEKWNVDVDKQNEFVNKELEEIRKEIKNSTITILELDELLGDDFKRTE